MKPTAIHVVAAALIDAQERVLIAQRPMDKHMGGGWEFPGGKLEAGEEPRAGLARELREELGITDIAAPRPLIRVHHTYPTRAVLLDMWVVKRYRGFPQGLDGQALRWCSQDELATVELLPADKPIVAALRLPERLTEASSRHYHVGRGGGGLRGELCGNAAEARAAAEGGADFLGMHAVLPVEELSALCSSVAVPVFARGPSLEEAWAFGASGLNEL